MQTDIAPDLALGKWSCEQHELAGTNINLNLRDIDAPDAIRSCPKQLELGFKVKDIVARADLKISKEAVQLFINQYHQHPFGNHRLEEAGALMRDLVQQEETERMIALEKAHLESGFI